jgi:hypothetical protein
LEHAAPLLCQAPVALQFCGCWPVHCSWPGAHEPVHTSLMHVWLTHAAPTVQVPDALQVSGWFAAEQPVCSGVQTPTQLPPTHAWFEHAVP